MTYSVELKPQAFKDLKRLQKSDARRMINALETLAKGLQGDIKRLTNYTPEYRLRVGNYRILFELEQGNRVIIYRVLPRQDAYKKRK